jgi:hypothetical protein
MTINEGAADRAIRIGIGFALLLLLILLQGSAKYWGFLGLIPLITGLMGNCPLYSLLGVKTCAEAKA